MYTLQEIILKSRREGKSLRSIARELGIHRKTVTRYIKQFETQQSEASSTSETLISQQLSIPPKYDASGRSKKKLTPQVTKMIDSLLSENELKRQQGPTKQLLKKSDIHEHLRDQGMDIGYTTVCSYNSSQKGQSRQPEAFIRQHYEPRSICEFDWGEFHLEVGGKSQRFYLPVFTSAYSNYRYAQLYSRQDTLAYLESHVAFFAHTNAVYGQKVYDNMRVAIARFTGYEKEPTEALLQLRGHYQFTHHFTNFYRGNEKGYVERPVEYVRRKTFGLKYKFNSIEEYNTPQK